jgi:SAM-dependent methyltransferase
MSPAAPSLKVELVVPDESPEKAFDRVVDELRHSLPRSALRLDPGPAGRLVETGTEGGDREFARVEAWDRGRRIAFAWHPSDWAQDDPPVPVVLRFDPAGGGTRISVEFGDWGPTSPLGSADERTGWFVSELMRPLFRAASPSALGDWLTDRKVRRPTGEGSRATYADPIYHRPNFLVLLERLHLNSEDSLLEVGCGGGAFLHDALQSGCRAFAIDHSPDMVRVAREQNRNAIDEGRLEVREADAHRLPFPDALCSCAVSTGAFGFFERPGIVLAEIRRVLRPGGRLVLFSSSKEMKGTPAAPEPYASRIRFYEDQELVDLARAAGFVEVTVDRPDFGPYARKAGLSAEAVAFFESGPRAGQVLEARRA